MNKLSKKTIKWLDSLDDAELIFWLYSNFGCDEPVWEEITKKEYEKVNAPLPEGQPITYSDLEKIAEVVLSGIQYKKEPIGVGLFDRLKGKEPKGYKYYKSTHTERVLLISAALADYVNKREIHVNQG